MTPLSIEQFRQVLPDRMKKSLNPEIVDRINAVLADPDMYEQYRENFLSYTSVMQDGRWTIDEYLSAVKYVSHKLMGRTNIDAYSITFPEKILRFQSQGVVAKDVASYVTAYNKSKLVNAILEQTLVPMHVLNQALYQQALNVQADLMVNANSEKVRSDAANSLLTHLKAPEATKIELDVKTKEDGSIAALRAATLELARAQKLALEAGAMNAQQVAHTKLVMGDVVDVQVVEVQP